MLCVQIARNTVTPSSCPSSTYEWFPPSSAELGVKVTLQEKRLKFPTSLRWSGLACKYLSLPQGMYASAIKDYSYSSTQVWFKKKKNRTDFQRITHYHTVWSLNNNKKKHSRFRGTSCDFCLKNVTKLAVPVKLYKLFFCNTEKYLQGCFFKKKKKV